MRQPDFRLSQSHSLRSTRFKHQVQITAHMSKPSEQRERRGWAERESRGKRLLPASEVQDYTCSYLRCCYSGLLQRIVILTSRLQVRASFTVHFSLAKSAKRSRSVAAALGCFHPLLKCSQAPQQTFCTRHCFEKEIRVAFPLDTTEGILDRQNVITQPGVWPGVEPKTPTLMQSVTKSPVTLSVRTSVLRLLLLSLILHG